MKKIHYCGSAFIFIAFHIAMGQVEVPLVNGSFEGTPTMGTYPNGLKLTIAGWQNWSPFELKSPPDIHGAHTNYWNVQRFPFHGETYVGLVIREDETWECIAQSLQEPLEEGGHYSILMYTCRDSMYKSRLTPTGEILNFSNPAQIRIWGSEHVKEFGELLAESGTVEHTKWQKQTFDLFPSKTYKYIILQAYYPSEDELAMNGHVLIDNAKLWKYE
ncbi:MAG TPA: hypothetical protein VI603_18480 [Saprospiraceae bacterium]|nr:hypothetical protein [Saprospiraceae bacterium]